MAYWLFQANPTYHRILDAMARYPVQILNPTR